jgi:hypothetical protein
MLGTLGLFCFFLLGRSGVELRPGNRDQTRPVAGVEKVTRAECREGKNSWARMDP